MPGNGELNESTKCEIIPTTIEEIKILMENFLKNLLGSDKNGEDEDGLVGIKDNYDEIFSKHEEILVYLQGIRDNLLKTQQKSGVVSSVTSNEISKTFSYEENRGTTQQEMDEELEELIVHWARFCNDIGKSFSNHETYVNYIQRMRLSLK